MFPQNSDDDEVSSPFFPSKSKPSTKLDLSDTFSLQEMTINSDSGDETDDSQNLELLPPSVRKQYVNKFINYVCCFNGKVWIRKWSINKSKLRIHLLLAYLEGEGAAGGIEKHLELFL